MDKFKNNNRKTGFNIGKSFFTLTPDKKLYWISTREDEGIVPTFDIKMGFVTSVQEEGGAYITIGDSLSFFSPELASFTVKGFYWDDEWDCYQIEMESNV